jgi:2-(1,2-epoxy-1,2-dihydrophenyl)acetyl-CoA isomerase
MADESVLLAIEEGVARLTLNRPDAGNAIDPTLAAAFRGHAEAIASDGSVRAVVLAAAGPNFCVGGDLGFMAAQGDDVGPALRALVDDLHAGILALQSVDAPIVGEIRGAVAGAGIGLVCGTDIALASETAKLSLAYTAAGLTPDGGATWLLPRIVGARKAAELLLLNPRLSAEEAAALGLVTRAVADDALADEVAKLVGRLAAGPTTAFGTVRRLLHASATTEFADQLVGEASGIAAAAAGVDGREGVAAFLAKRRPVFTGA